MQDPRVVKEEYGEIKIDNDQIEEIGENSLAKMNFKTIRIGKCFSLKRIHSNAFEHQFKQTTTFSVSATNIYLDIWPYNFYDLVNSFHKLSLLRFSSRIGILEEKFGANLNKLLFLFLSVDSIKGSPFSNMSSITLIDLSKGGLNYISNNAFKLGHARDNVLYFLPIDLSFNNLNGSSFEKGVFTHQTLKNRSIQLYLNDNNINYLDKQVFFPFLLTGNNRILNLTNNPLDCDDCRSAWICQSISVPDGESMKRLQITQLIDVNAKCSDNKRSFGDCETGFFECESFEIIESISNIMNETTNSKQKTLSPNDTKSDENCETRRIVMIVVSSASIISILVFILFSLNLF
jgi:hypothetical protein